MVRNRKRIIEFAAKTKLPAIYTRPEFVDDGGLLSYSASIVDLTRRSATYVDKILKGAKPADLPVEQPIKFDFIVNLRAAKRIDLTIPQSVLYRADQGDQIAGSMEQRARSRERREHRSRFMRRKFFGLALSTLLLALCFPAQAQPQPKVPKIGLLRARLAASGTSLEGFLRELRALGYVEGKEGTFRVSIRGG